jgi:hypothetical protein
MKVFLILLFTFFNLNAFSQLKGYEIIKISLKDSIQLDKVWKEIKIGIETKNKSLIIKNSLSKIDCDICLKHDYEKGPPENYLVLVDTFINMAFSQLLDSQLWKAVNKKKYSIMVSKQPHMKLDNVHLGKNETLKLYEIFYVTYEANEWAEGHEGQDHVFQFVKIKNEFKFYGLTSIP